MEIASDIAPIMSRAKECLDEWDERPSDHSHTRAENSMLYLTEKIKLTMNNLKDVYEKQPKCVSAIFNRDCMMDLFISMLQECVNGGEYV